MQFIDSHNPIFQRSGRTEITQDGNELWVFPYTQIRASFTGTSLAVRVRNYWNYGQIRLGVIIDHTQLSVRIPSPTEPELGNCTQHEDGSLTIPIADYLPNIEHNVIIFKRQDGGMHYLEMMGIYIDDTASISAPYYEIPRERRIEFFGDSVSCGERNEAVEYTGKADPDVDLSAYSNSYWAYSAIAGRALDADVHITAQGGASLIDGIGWFNAPNYLGMESIYDRVKYNPALGESSAWDFTKWTPQIAVVALGQNDSNPYDFMDKEYDGEQSRMWRSRYVDFLREIRNRYPRAFIIATTTMLQHSPRWDQAIGQACDEFDDSRVLHLTYDGMGTRTPGHPRIAEDEQMAAELVTAIEALGDDVWKEDK